MPTCKRVDGSRSSLPQVRWLSGLTARLGRRAPRLFLYLSFLALGQNVAWAVNEVQQITLSNVTATQVTVGYGGGTATFAPGAAAATVQTAVAGLPGLSVSTNGMSNVSVTGSSTAAGGGNLAVGGTVTVDAEMDTTVDERQPSTMFDNNWGTMWRPQYPTERNITYALATAQAVNEVKVWATQQNTIGAITISGSNTGNFVQDGQTLNTAPNLTAQDWPDAGNAAGGNHPGTYVYTANFTNSTPYNYYRIDESGASGGQTGIAEIQLLNTNATGSNGTYNVTFVNGKANTNVPQLTTTTPGVTISTNPEGGPDPTPGPTPTPQPTPTPDNRPGVPTYENIGYDHFTVVMPTKPSGASSLSLQWLKTDAQGQVTPVTVATGMAGGSTSKVQFDATHPLLDTTCPQQNTDYTFQAVSIVSGNPQPGGASTVTTLRQPPDAPQAPVLIFKSCHKLKVQVPLVWPDRADSMTLMMKTVPEAPSLYIAVGTATEPGQEFELDSYDNPGDATAHGPLVPNTSYALRCVAYNGAVASEPGAPLTATTRNLPGQPAAPVVNPLRATQFTTTAQAAFPDPNPQDSTSFTLQQRELVNEKQIIHLQNADPSGTITVNYHGGSASFAPGADAAVVQAALAGLPGVGAGNVQVTSHLTHAGVNYATPEGMQASNPADSLGAVGAVGDHNFQTLWYPAHEAQLTATLPTARVVTQLGLWVNHAATVYYATVYGSADGQWDDGVQLWSGYVYQSWTPDAQQPGLSSVTLPLPGTIAYKAYRVSLPNGSYTPPAGGYPGGGYPGSSVARHAPGPAPAPATPGKPKPPTPKPPPKPTPKPGGKATGKTAAPLKGYAAHGVSGRDDPGYPSPTPTPPSDPTSNYGYGIAEVQLLGPPVYSGDYTVEFTRGLAGQNVDQLGVDASSAPGVSTNTVQEGHVGDWTINLAQNVQPGQSRTIQSLIPQTTYQIRWEAVGYDPADVTPGPPLTITTTPPEVDAMIQNAGDTAFIGQGVWSLDGDGETKSQWVKVGDTATYNIQVTNSEPYSDDFLITGPGSDAKWTVSYFDAQGHDITAQVTGAGYTAHGLGVGQTCALSVEVAPNQGVADGDTKEVLVTATIGSDTAQADAVLATTTCVTLPTAVTVTVQQPVGLHQVTLTWTPNTDRSFDHYALYRSSPGQDVGAATLVTLLHDAAQTSYTDQNLAANTDYSYTVVVYNQAGLQTAAPPALAHTAVQTWIVGSGIQGGALIAPVDQRSAPGSPGGGGGYPGGGGGYPGGGGGYPSSGTVQVKVGDTVPCLVQEATDQDHWQVTASDGTVLDAGDSDDGVTYQWSCADGGSFTGDTTSRGARWQAPTTPGTYTLKCVINDAATAIGSDETGTRDDPGDLERTVTVQVVPDEPPCTAKLKLYPDVNGAPGTVEKYDPIGGKMWGVLELWVEAGQEVDPSLNNVNIRLEEASLLHTEANNHIDKTVDFTTYAGWEKWDGTQWVALQPGETPKATSPLAAGVKYRWKFLWATTTIATGDSASVLLGHNEQHVLELVQVNGANGNTITFQDGNGNVYSSGPKVQTAKVQNLVITDAQAANGTADYFKFDPSSDDSTLLHPQITFTFANQGDPTTQSKRYHWWFWVRETTINGPSDFVTYEGDMDAPGQQVVTINQDGTSYQKTGGNNLSVWGTYAFDIHVKDTKTGDWIGIRSDKIQVPAYQVPAYMVDDQGNPVLDDQGKPVVDSNGKPRPGHSLDLWADDTTYKLQASYYLKSDRDASQMKIDLVNPNLQRLTTLNGGVLKEHPYLGIDMHTFADQDPMGNYKGIFVATDSYKEQYRDHKNEAMLAVNDTKAPPMADNYYWMVNEPATSIQKRIPAMDESVARLQRQVAHIKEVYNAAAQGKAGPPLRTGYRARANGQGIGDFQFATQFFLDNLKSDSIAYEYNHGLLEGGIVLGPVHAIAGHFSNTSPNHNGSAEFVDSIATKAQLVMYESCLSGLDNPEGHGNLLAETCNSGVQMAIGFDTEINSGEKNQYLPIYYDYPQVWATSFFQGLTRGRSNYQGSYLPLTVKYAKDFALDQIKNTDPLGTYVGYQSVNIQAKNNTADVYLTEVDK